MMRQIETLEKLALNMMTKYKLNPLAGNTLFTQLSKKLQSTSFGIFKAFSSQGKKDLETFLHYMMFSKAPTSTKKQHLKTLMEETGKCAQGAINALRYKADQISNHILSLAKNTIVTQAIGDFLIHARLNDDRETHFRIKLQNVVAERFGLKKSKEKAIGESLGLSHISMATRMITKGLNPKSVGTTLLQLLLAQATQVKKHSDYQTFDRALTSIGKDEEFKTAHLFTLTNESTRYQLTQTNESNIESAGVDDELLRSIFIRLINKNVIQ